MPARRVDEQADSDARALYRAASPTGTEQVAEVWQLARPGAQLFLGAGGGQFRRAIRKPRLPVCFVPERLPVKLPSLEEVRHFSCVLPWTRELWG